MQAGSNDAEIIKRINKVEKELLELRNEEKQAHNLLDKQIKENNESVTKKFQH